MIAHSDIASAKNRYPPPIPPYDENHFVKKALNRKSYEVVAT